LGTNNELPVSKCATVRETADLLFFQVSWSQGYRVSYGEQIALRGHGSLEEVAPATLVDVRLPVDEQFLERLRRGDTAAFDCLVKERSGDVYALLYRLTEDAEEARDLTQETFLRAFQSISRFRGEADLKTWIYRIAINQARNRWRWWRRRRRDVHVSLDAAGRQSDRTLAERLPANDGNPEQQTLAHERETVLRTALNSLGRSYRETVILRDVEGFSYEEIAATLEISIGTVKSRLSRGRLELRRKLTGSL
jgi:RNA polymerase sigma-70 factor (ECF subfamily)